MPQTKDGGICPPTPIKDGICPSTPFLVKDWLVEEME
jgi:hypothetical protein